jgi:hypothetical protein
MDCFAWSCLWLFNYMADLSKLNRNNNDTFIHFYRARDHEFNLALPSYSPSSIITLSLAKIPTQDEFRLGNHNVGSSFLVMYYEAGAKQLDRQKRLQPALFHIAPIVNILPMFVLVDRSAANDLFFVTGANLSKSNKGGPIVSCDWACY